MGRGVGRLSVGLGWLGASLGFSFLWAATACGDTGGVFLTTTTTERQAVESRTTPCIASDLDTLTQCVDRVNAGLSDNIEIAASISCAACGFALINCSRPLLIYGSGRNPGITRTSYASKSILYLSGCNPSGAQSGDWIHIQNLTLAETHATPTHASLLGVSESSFVEIDGVTLNDSAYFGITVVKSYDVRISKCTIRNSAYQPFWSAEPPYLSTNLVLANNLFENNRGNIQYNSSGGEIRGNVFNHNHRIPFYGYSGGQLLIDSYSSNILVKGNQIVNGYIDDQTQCTNQTPPCVVNGIEFPPSTTKDVTMANNTINDHTGWGIVKNDGGSQMTGIVIENNRLYANAAGNIKFPEADATRGNCYSATCPFVWPRGIIIGSPNPCFLLTAGSQCNTTVSWVSSNVVGADVYVGPSLFSSNSTGSQTASWISSKGAIFDLKAGDELLDRVYVGAVTARCGDAVCSNGETCGSCPNDCGQCIPVYANSFEQSADFSGWTTWHNCAANSSWSVDRFYTANAPAPGGGLWALRMHTTAFQPSCSFPGAYTATPAVGAVPGKTYFVESWSRNGIGVGATMIIFFDASGAYLSSVSTIWREDAWLFGADSLLTAVAPAGAASFRLRFDLYGASAYGDVDLVRVTRTQ